MSNLERLLAESDEDNPLSNEDTNRLISLINDDDESLDVSDIIAELECYDKNIHRKFDSSNTSRNDTGLKIKENSHNLIDLIDEQNATSTLVISHMETQSTLEWEDESETRNEDSIKENDKNSSHNNLFTSVQEYVEEEDVEQEPVVPLVDNMYSVVWQSGYNRDSVGCGTQLTGQSDNYFICKRKVEINSNVKVFEYTLRPDVCADSIMSLVEQVFLSFGGTTTNSDTSISSSSNLSLRDINDTKQAENSNEVVLSHQLYISFAKNVQSDANSVEAFLGTNICNRRVLLITIYPLKSSNILQSASNSATFHNFITSMHGSVSNALHSEQYTISYLLPSQMSSITPEQHLQNNYLNFNRIYGVEGDNAHHHHHHHHDFPSSTTQLTQVPNVTDVNIGNYHSSVPVLDSVVDPTYVCDLIQTFAHNAEVDASNLMRDAMSSIQKLEKSCARLMTLLKPQYLLSQLVMCSPPQKPKQNDLFYDENAILGSLKPNSIPSNESKLTSGNHHSRDRASGPNLRLPDLKDKIQTMEFARLLIFRARREYLRYMNDLKLASDSNNLKNNSIVNNPFSNNVLSPQYVELECIVKYILKQLNDMFEHEVKCNILPKKIIYVAYRIQQIQLYRRYIVSVLCSRHIKSVEDREQFKTAQSKFRVINEQDPILIEVRAIMSGGDGFTPSMLNAIAGGRAGVLCVTRTHIYFHSDALIFMNAIHKVIPLDTISNISVIPSTMVASEGVAIQDRSASPTITTFYPSTLDPNYGSRLSEFLKYLNGENALIGRNANIDINSYNNASRLEVTYLKIVCDLLSVTFTSQPELFRVLRRPFLDSFEGGLYQYVHTRSFDITYLLKDEQEETSTSNANNNIHIAPASGATDNASKSSPVKGVDNIPTSGNNSILAFNAESKVSVEDVASTNAQPPKKSQLGRGIQVDVVLYAAFDSNVFLNKLLYFYTYLWHIYRVTNPVEFRLSWTNNKEILRKT